MRNSLSGTRWSHRTGRRHGKPKYSTFPALPAVIAKSREWRGAAKGASRPERSRDPGDRKRQLVRLSFARAKKLARAAECLVYSLTPSGAENHPKNRGFVGILRGQKCLRRRFSQRSPVGEGSRGARSMPRVFGRGSRSQPAALVSDRDPAHLFLFKLPPFVARWSSTSHSV
jgi:hypothetical protein